MLSFSNNESFPCFVNDIFLRFIGSSPQKVICMTSKYSMTLMLFFSKINENCLAFETSAPQTLMYQLKKATYNPKTHLISHLPNNPYIFLTLEEMLFFVHYLEVPNFETINTDRTKVIESERQERRSFRMSSIFIQIIWLQVLPSDVSLKLHVHTNTRFWPISFT